MTAFKTLCEQVPLRFTLYMSTFLAQFTCKAKFNSVCVIHTTEVSIIPQNYHKSLLLEDIVEPQKYDWCIYHETKARIVNSQILEVSLFACN